MLRRSYPQIETVKPIYRDFRAGDIIHSQAEIVKARKFLGYNPTHTLEQGLEVTLEWYKCKVKLKSDAVVT